jgi:glycosyltransferase involved in cell wall biosynthesis
MEERLNRNLRILIIPGYRMYPCDTGAGLAQWAIIEGLRHQMDIHIVLDEQNVPQEYLNELREMWPEVTFHSWMDWKEAWESYAQKSLKYRIERKLFPWPEPEGPINPPEGLPEALIEHWNNATILFRAQPEWRVKALEHHLRNHHYGLVQTDLPSNVGLVRKPIRGTVTVHVCHEPKHKRFKEAASALAVDSNPEYQSAYGRIRSKELSLMATYDRLMVFSEEDRYALERPGGPRICVSPFPVHPDRQRVSEHVRPTRLLFLGSGSHGPNREGLIRFVKENGQQASGLPLHVVGRWAASERKDVEEWPEYHGFVEELEVFLRDSVMLIPIYSGAGIRTKALEAMASKVPIIATTFAMEGLGAEAGVHYLELSNESELSELWDQIQDDDSRQMMVESAHRLFESSFGFDALIRQRYTCLTD